MSAPRDIEAELIRRTSWQMQEIARLRAELAKSAIKDAIIQELFTCIRRCDGSPDLLAIIGSYGDTLEDSEVLKLLREWNESGKVIHERQ